MLSQLTLPRTKIIWARSTTSIYNKAQERAFDQSFLRVTWKMKKGKGETALITWDCGSALYDSVELASLAHLLERRMMAFPALDRSNNASRSEGGGTAAKITKNFHRTGASARYVDGKSEEDDDKKEEGKRTRNQTWSRVPFVDFLVVVVFLKKWIWDFEWRRKGNNKWWDLQINRGKAKEFWKLISVDFVMF